MPQPIKTKDILLSPDGDLTFANGDFVVGESDEQHIQHILVAEKGDFREYPIVGVGLIRYLNSPNDSSTKTDLQLRIKKQLENDGYSVTDIAILDALNIDINAKRLQ